MKLLSDMDVALVAGGEENILIEACHAVGTFVGDAAAWYEANIGAISAGYNSGEHI